ncbi:uncharacterized protein A4U43_C03F8750 [Asparagus officinalis]|uniref:Pentacotripeptide-repeat region of PRORP domain-containing protein n=1 Tax=Asparagus officinalis TaxID=4686 RepID=A0A5P1FA99_ASPOF|nr:pentatricopeptide repeat-containing protein At1g28690, mitochondrial [Asparagus officinalis]XP_020256448.1 pentatricopeptide repeat-containing protein At1g28690, mitochondrial [Asparagus officinalis]XP_020256450.1 pentatricopeptide repeat-containing protein At1g28690, mitochondrial [Asparagus officinalis]ONK74653.1 uncharacterized protein A4U43_C03F8750 [Asparagus officinalis]
MNNGKLVINELSPLIRTLHSLSTNPNPNSISLPNPSSIASALQHFINSNSPSPGQSIHAHILKSGFNSTTNISIKLLILHVKSGSLYNARKVFDKMLKPTLSAYNYMIAGYFKANIFDESLQLIRKIALSDERPDGFTLSMALKISGVNFSLRLAKQVHSQIVRLELEKDEVLFAALIDSYVKNGKLSYARSIFESMPNRNLVCSTALLVGYMNEQLFIDAKRIFDTIIRKDIVIYNAMIEGYSRTAETAMRSLELYKDMQSFNFMPTVSSFVSVIGACCLLSALEFGVQVHNQIIKMNDFSHVKCGSALVDMYSKCGRIKHARSIFDRMPEKNVITWTAMIDGYGKNGIADNALELFNLMRDSRVKPNHATFLSVLSACGHAGLVSNGKEVFESMEKDFGLKPRMEHYACMVDILGRSGNLSEAYNFILRIPEKPNSDVWAALLGASRFYGDVEMADIAAKKVFELTGKERPGAYMALSNAFAAVGNWDGVSEVRELMKVRGVSKGAGRSWLGTDKS